jgi:hypothetical protein
VNQLQQFFANNMIVVSIAWVAIQVAGIIALGLWMGRETK